MIKVLLADDQELIRQSLSFVMSRQEDIEMVGTAANGCEALELVEEKQPDVVLLDIRMPEMDGVECTRRIKQEFPGIKVIILTTFDDDDYMFDALRYGASGYLLKGVVGGGIAVGMDENCPRPCAASISGEQILAAVRGIAPPFGSPDTGCGRVW